MDITKYPLAYTAWQILQTGADLQDWIMRLTPENYEKMKNEVLEGIQELMIAARQEDESYKSQGIQSFKQAILLSTLMQALEPNKTKAKKSSHDNDLENLPAR